MIKSSQAAAAAAAAYGNIQGRIGGDFVQTSLRQMSHNSNSVVCDLNLHRWVQKHVQYWEHFEIVAEYVWRTSFTFHANFILVLCVVLWLHNIDV